MAKETTKSALAQRLAKQMRIPNKTAMVLLEGLAAVADTGRVKNTFTIPGIGKLILANRKARMARNPRTGQPTTSPAKRVAKSEKIRGAKKTEATPGAQSAVGAYNQAVQLHKILDALQKSRASAKRMHDRLLASGLADAENQRAFVRDFEELEELADKARSILGSRLPDPELAGGKSIQVRFSELAEQWEKDSEFVSSTRHMSMLPSYQAIIGMGPAAAPLILQRLRTAPDHWFWALEAITRQNPVPDALRGNVQEMARLWLDWGRREGMIRE